MARQLTAEEMTEAAIWAEGTRYTKDDIVRAYRHHLGEAEERGLEAPDIQTFCQLFLAIAPVIADAEAGRFTRGGGE